MKAGEIEINILANYQQIEKDLREVESRAQQAGDRAGRGFKTEFMSKSQAQAEQIFGKFQGIKAVEGLARSMASFLRSDKSIGEALVDSLKSVPFAGAFVDLGEAIFDTIYNATIGASEEAARQQARIAEQEYAAHIEAVEKSAQEDVENAKRAAELRQDYAEEFRRGEIEFLEKRIETEADLEELFQRKRNDIIAKSDRDSTKAMNEARSDLETHYIHHTYEKRKQIALEALDVEMQNRRTAMDKEQQKQIDDAKAIVDKKAKDEKDAADILAKKRKDDFEKYQQDVEDEEERRKAVLASGMTSANTALGTFTFDAYTDAEKKQIDQESLRTLKLLATNIQAMGIQ